MTHFSGPRAIQITEPYYPHFRHRLIHYSNRAIPIFHVTSKLKRLREVDFRGCLLDSTLIEFIGSIGPQLSSLRVGAAILPSAEVWPALASSLANLRENLETFDISQLGHQTGNDLMQILKEAKWPNIKELRLWNSAFLPDVEWVVNMPKLEMLTLSLLADAGDLALDFLSSLRKLRLLCVFAAGLSKRFEETWSAFHIHDDTPLDHVQAQLKKSCLHKFWLSENAKDYAGPEVRLYASAAGIEHSFSQFAMILRNLPEANNFIVYWKAHERELAHLTGPPDWSCFTALQSPASTSVYDRLGYVGVFKKLFSLGLDLCAPIPAWERDDGACPLLLIAAQKQYHVRFALTLGAYSKHVQDAPRRLDDARGRNLLMYACRGAGSALEHDTILKMWKHPRIQACLNTCSLFLCSPDTADLDGNTALHHALFVGSAGYHPSDAGYFETAKNLRQENAQGHTPFYISLFYNAFAMGAIKLEENFTVHFTAGAARGVLEQSLERQKYYLFDKAGRPADLYTRLFKSHFENVEWPEDPGIVGPSIPEIHRLCEARLLTLRQPAPPAPQVELEAQPPKISAKKDPNCVVC